MLHTIGNVLLIVVHDVFVKVKCNGTSWICFMIRNRRISMISSPSLCYDTRFLTVDMFQFA